MCGICGFVGFQDDELLLQMMGRLIHRGPDEGGYYSTPEVSLGHRRLSIIDLKSGGQPLSNEDGTVWVVYNGEIYNFKEIREDLERRGHHFTTASDTEIIVHAYEEYGIDCLHKFNGMWVFALWDTKTKSFYLTRDRLGIKSVYYLWDADKFMFASEYKALLEYPKAPGEVDLGALDRYLTWRYVPGADSLFKGFRRLPPAHYLLLKDGKAAIHRYWALHMSEELDRSDSEWLEQFRESFMASVRRHLISDVPLGVFLSGGIDSSAIVGTMSALGHRPIETFSVGFNTGHDEIGQAHHVAERFGTNHHEFILNPDHLDLLPEIIWYQEDPVGDAILLPIFLLSRLASEYVKVVLTGEGADELLGGYVHQAALLKGAKLDRATCRVLRLIASAVISRIPVRLLDSLFEYPASMGKEGRRRLSLFVNMDNPDDRYRLMGALLTPREKSALYKNDLRYSLQMTPESCGDSFRADLPLGNQLIAREIGGWLPDNILFKQDRLSMANSIETRVPYLDYQLVELSARLPWKLKNDGRINKVALRRALTQLLPQEIRNRKKRAFYMPLTGSYRRKFQQLVHSYLSPERLRRRGLFREERICFLLEKMDESSLVYSKQLMALVILEMWFDIFVDGHRPGPRRDFRANASNTRRIGHSIRSQER